MASRENLKAAGEALTGAADTVYRATKETIDEGKVRTEKLAEATIGALTGGNNKATATAAVPPLEIPRIDDRALPASPTSDDARELSGTGGGSSTTANSSSRSHAATITTNEQHTSSSASSEKHADISTTSAPVRRSSSLLVGEIEEVPSPAQSSTGFLSSTTAQIACIVALAFVASYSSLKSIGTQRTVPLYLAAIWTVLGILFGLALHPMVVKDATDAAATIGDTKNDAAAETRTGKGDSSVSASPMPGQDTVATTPPIVDSNSATRRMKNAVVRVLRIRSPGELLVGSSDCEPVKERSLPMPVVLQPLSSLSAMPGSIWTTLQGKKERAKTRWEHHAHDRPASELMERLLAYPDFRTKPREQSTATEPVSDTSRPSGYGTFDGTTDEEGEQEISPTKAFGQVNTGNPLASVLQADIEVDPLFKLRGMDIFRSNNPEEKIWRQPILER
mmetsp:Transcript_20269/g.41328  ORF Transcript_20269/g.41328 Transcript_20269/m.41328 type:complete len:450 (-) Transcript_20269:1339-2688(-)